MATVQTTTTAATETAVSLPLYLSGLTVTLCGVLTVADTIGDSGFTAMTVLLTLVGFAFSLGCRLLRINARVIEWLCLGLIALGVFGALTQRVDWGALTPPGLEKNDEKLAVFLCWMATLRSWVLFSDDAVLFSPVLSIAAIGLVASFDLNDYVAFFFCACVVAATFLLIHAHSLRQRALASAEERVRAMPGGMAAQFGLAVLCGLAVIGLGCLLIVPLEAISKNLSLAGAIRQLARLSPSTNAAPQAYRFSDDATFMVGMGEGWSSSPQVMMRVTPDDGLPHYWRGRTYDRYAGTGWLSTLDGQAPREALPLTPQDDGSQTYTLPTLVYPERPLLTATFDVLGDTDNMDYAPEPRRLTLYTDLGAAPRLMADGRLDLAGRSLLLQRYTVTSLVAPDPMDPAVQGRLRRAGANYPSVVRRHYLGNMGDSDGTGEGLASQSVSYFHQAVAEALRGLPPDRRTPLDEALAIRDWVSARCTYSLAAPALPEHADHVYEFLAHARRGYCDMFASSMAVLCRVAGIPARVATGFAPGEQDGRVFNLRVMDKHAWTEVYFPGEGWLTFDPTVGTQTDTSIPRPTAQHAWNWPHFFRSLGPGPLTLGGLILALLLYIAKTEWYDPWRARRVGSRRPQVTATARQTEVGRRYARMAQILSVLGLPRDSAETPGEYAARAQAFLDAQGPRAPSPAIVAALTAQFIAARYGGGVPPTPAQAEQMEQGLRAFSAAATRLRRVRAWSALARQLTAESAVPSE